MVIENARANAAQLRNLGHRAVAEAKREGVAVYYMDPALGDGIIKELPDGTRQRVRIGPGEDVVIETLPRA